jgi:hypothetical protein
MAITKIQSESLNLADTYAFTGTVTGAGGNMTPSFHAYGNQVTGATSSAWTKIPLQNEVFDNGNCFDNSTNYRFTPNVAGKYYLHARLVGFDSGNALNNVRINIYKNGSRLAGGYQWVTSGSTAPVRHFDVQIFTTDSANGSSDYYEIYYFIKGNSTLYLSADPDTPRGISFYGHKIIE